MNHNPLSLFSTMTLMFIIVFSVLSLPAIANPNASKLTVVQDHGGVSALPYFEELGLLAEPTTTPIQTRPKNAPASVEAMLPVRSERLTPGQVTSKTIQAPNLTPIFLIGDDDLSKRWLYARKDALQQMKAIGLVINVESVQALQALQAIVPNVQLSPVSGDDIAQRLGLQHYPVLITSTHIEQ